MILDDVALSQQVADRVTKLLDGNGFGKRLPVVCKVFRSLCDPAAAICQSANLLQLRGQERSFWGRTQELGAATLGV